MDTMSRYTHALTELGVELDGAQTHVLGVLAELENSLAKPPSLLGLLKGQRKSKTQGVYIWGNVGRGKTFLMDLFFNTLHMERKKRVHFQSFMKHIHSTLFRLSGKKDPLKLIAREWAEKVDIICLDEFYIDDVADATLIEGLFRYLYQEGVGLVITSNLHPDQLYPEGLKNEHFRLAIAQIKAKLNVVCLNGEKDYRLLTRPTYPVFFFKSSKANEQELEKYYKSVTAESDYVPGLIEINQRKFNFKASRHGVIWFDFQELCEKSRSQYDYIEIAQNFHTLLISAIPQLDHGHEQGGSSSVFNTNRTRRFISLIDEIYDRSVKLAASFETDLKQIYLGTELKFQFERTLSRLTEMQTHDYALRPHRSGE